jgi:hypothetical protein
MITIPRSCFTIFFFFFFLVFLFFSLLHLPYLFHFLISNFPLTSQLLIYSTFIIIQNNLISSLIPSNLILLRVASKYRKMSTLLHRLKYPIFKINRFAIKIKNKGLKSNLLICSNSKVKMITILRSCFIIFFFFLHLSYLLHFLISNFPLTSQFLIYSTFIIIQNNPISSLIPSNLILLRGFMPSCPL